MANLPEENIDNYNSKDNKLWLHSIVIIFNIAVLVCLFFLKDYSLVEDNLKVRQSIRNIKESSLILDKYIIQLKFLQLQNYDPLVYLQGELRRNLSIVKRSSHKHILDEKTKNILAETENVLKESNDKIEYIKMSHSLLGNSNYYFYKLVKELVSEFQKFQQNSSFANDLIMLKEKLSRNSIVQDVKTFDEVQQAIKKLDNFLMKAQLSNKLGPNTVTQEVTSKLLSLIKHSEIMLTKTQELREDISTYFAVPKNAVFDNLFDVYETIFYQEKQMSDKMIMLFYIMLLGASLHVVYLIYRISAQNKKILNQADDLKTALDKQKELNELQRKFVSMVSHEFRTPLAIIDSGAQKMLRREGKLDPEKITHMATRTRSQISRLIDLLDSTLNTQRMESGVMQFMPSSCNPQKILNEICRNQSDISLNKINLDLSQLPTEIMADEKLLHHVFSNLISNAVKYSPDDSDVNVYGQQLGEEFEIEISDQGVGIPAEEISNLFNCFFRATTSVGIPGTGVGLHLVKKIVDMHSGKIDVISKVGEGSKFIIRLPIKQSKQNEGNSLVEDLVA